MTRREAMEGPHTPPRWCWQRSFPSAVSAASLAGVGIYQFVVLTANGRDITFLTEANANLSVDFSGFLSAQLPVGMTGTLTGPCTATLGFPAGTVFTVKAISTVGPPLAPFPPGVYARPGATPTQSVSRCWRPRSAPVVGRGSSPRPSETG